jgi:acetamidase/formamidase
MTRPRSSARQHYLPANVDTVHWGYFSKKLKPQLEVDSGDIVTIETLTHQASDDHERMIEGDPGAESVYLWTKDKKGVFRRGAGEGDGKGLGVHICTGPVFVRGA